jgi:hypothetical protein
MRGTSGQGNGHEKAPRGTKTFRATDDSSLLNVRSFIEQEGAESAELVILDKLCDLCGLLSNVWLRPPAALGFLVPFCG